MNTETLQDKIEATADNLDSRLQTQEVYTSLTTSNHGHNGIDAPQIQFSDLRSANTYIAFKSTNLTSAQLLALNTTPITIVPAMGINSAIIVEGITALLKYSGTAYAGTNNIEIRYTNGAGTKVTADIPVAFLNTVADAYSFSPQITTNITPVLNSPIVAYVPTANPTTGNSVVTLTIKYRIAYFR